MFRSLDDNSTVVSNQYVIYHVSVIGITLVKKQKARTIFTFDRVFQTERKNVQVVEI